MTKVFKYKDIDLNKIIIKQPYKTDGGHVCEISYEDIPLVIQTPSDVKYNTELKEISFPF